MHVSVKKRNYVWNVKSEEDGGAFKMYQYVLNLLIE